ncbi:MAG: PTS sugar transporter subunit IIA [Opitutaceae bacterium]|nr:PTS sugar transporter subunit IIA [Opitutaceae bacterium]
MSTPEFLTLGDVAATLGWTTRFVERLAAVGQLPGVEVNGQWQFRREDLVDWLDRKIQTLDTKQVADLEQKLEGELQAASRNIHIADRLKPEFVGLDVRAAGRIDVLKELVGLAERTGLVLDSTHLHASLVEREALASTALPGGFAICHPRRPAPHLLRRTLLSVLRTEQPIPFGAEDGKPTRLFFLIAAIDDRAHLYALARLTRVVRGATLDALLSAPSADAIIDIIRRREAEIDAAPAAPTPSCD